ncbi:hypothetical protein [Streptomyces sp. NPDC051452]|uniref:hypothetical protein n=1 Tax=Streptomyces sp. NPDC051452 TaxID=3365654 RepID=UPI00378A8171
MAEPTGDMGQNKAIVADRSLQTTRAWAGFLVILLGDVTITVAAIWGVTSADKTQAVAILTSAFTAVSAMTTAYFGIRAATNTAQSSMETATPPQP